MKSIKRVLAALFGAVLLGILVPIASFLMFDGLGGIALLAGLGAVIGAILGALFPRVFGFVFGIFFDEFRGQS